MDLDNAQNEENVWNNPPDVTTFGAKPATGLESFLDLMQDMKYIFTYLNPIYTLQE